MVYNGLTLAIIAGVPLGVLLAQGFGWRPHLSSAWPDSLRIPCSEHL
jgi:predicted MFS family arabinose efflux permease